MKRIIALVLLAILGLTSFSGCVAVSKYATPATIDPTALQYVIEAGVTTPDAYRGYANLEKAERLVRDVEAARIVYELGLPQTPELDYDTLAKLSAANTKLAQENEASLFSPTGLITLVAGLMGFGGFGGLIGLMRKRPGDITPADMEKAMTKAGMDVNDKERQMLEIVKGIQVFLTEYNKSSSPGKALRAALEAKTNTDTKQAVAVLKTM